MTRLQPRILIYESLPSTNTEAARLAVEGADEGLAIVADEQTAGRGRMKRSWASPKGAGLYFSLLLRPKISQDRWPLLTFVAALAVTDALRRGFRVETDIKWPNDILAGERKLCGILAEVVETKTGRAVIVGIGINLTSSAIPPNLLNVATSVADACNCRPDRDVLLQLLLEGIERWYSVLDRADGPDAILAAWTRQSSYASNKRVKISDAERTITGITKGLDIHGGLILEVDTGEQMTIMAGDVVSLRPSN